MPEDYSTIDEYIDLYPDGVKARLSEIRSIIQAVAPEVEETISYRIPALKLDGRILVYFAGWKDHVSLYPIPPGDDDFRATLAEYRHGKGTVRFSLDEPLPVGFIEQFVRLHVERIR